MKIKDRGSGGRENEEDEVGIDTARPYSALNS
jgi:hypothetical protein